MLGSNLDIMSPQWTDLIFKNRNQAYGAYELRKDNSRTTNRALIIAVTAFIFVLSIPTIVNAIKGFIPKADPPLRSIDVLIPPPPIEMKKEVKPPLPERQVRSPHDVVRFPPPIVRPDPEVHEEMAKDKDLDKAEVGQQNMKGDPNAHEVIDEPIGPKDVPGVTEGKPDEIFIGVEINPEYPGGEAAFGKFLRDHIRYPSVAKEAGTQGRVFLQFIVERDGSLTDMKILRDPGSGLGEEAERVLKMSPHWRAGIQNGKPVRVQYTVPINFSLAE
jgi:protein TonB